MTSLHRRDFLLRSTGTAAALGLPGGLASTSLFAAETSSDATRGLLKSVVGAGGASAGMVAVAVDGERVETASFGSSGAPGVALDAQTVFQIASITKVMTALLLADMEKRGEVSLDDPVARYLPPSLPLHERGRPITLLDLATYHSGLPNMPTNMPPRWWELSNPYAEYDARKLAAFLADYVPEVEPGAQYRYANLGFGLLGIALAHRAGKSYEQLLVDRICAPLGLGHTRIALTVDMRRHLAQGHDRSLKPVPMWDMPTLEGGGAVRSTASDLTVFLRAAMGNRRTSLQGPMTGLLETRRPTTIEGTDVGLGWFISSGPSNEIVWKTGLSTGFASFIGFSPRSGRGAIILSNGFSAPAVGFRLIDPDFAPQGDLDSILR